ncbi:MAG TPA: diaminopimelate epimerase, partial [Bacteroidales bacterium]|nr:diaminopimelate epimerase [Bacteroidales bacterium]
GGILHVAWDGKDVLLTGPAQEVFTGTFKFDNK